MSLNVAIAIGVGGTGRVLPVLHGAREDAREFAAWASRGGAPGATRYETKLIVDAPGRSIRVEDIRREIAPFLDDAIERLIIFFAGHGISTVGGDIWLLSDFDVEPEQAVNVALSVRTARRHPIAQLAVFSDACRCSVAQAAFIGGSSLFSIAKQQGRLIAQYDEFVSTDIGAVAQETVASNVAKASGVFSKCLIAALNGVESDALESRSGARVVTSQSLARWLQKVVPFETGKIPGGVVQIPWVTPGWMRPNDVHAEVPTGDEVSLPPISGQQKTLTGDFIGFGEPVALRRARHAEARIRVEKAFESRAVEVQARELLFRRARGHLSLETRRDISVVGAGVLEAVTGPGRHVIVFEEAGAWHVLGSGGVQSVAIRLATGAWVPAVILPGFVATLVVSEEGLQSLNYSPTFDKITRAHSRPVEELLDRWNASLAQRRGVEAISIEQFFATLKKTTLVNPVYGILAAYASDHAGRPYDVEVIASCFARVNKFLPFDIALLADGLDKASMIRYDRTEVSRFPLLSYGWNLLDPELTIIQRDLLDLRSGLLDAAWTSFEPEAGRRFAEMVRGGVL